MSQSMASGGAQSNYYSGIQQQTLQRQKRNTWCTEVLTCRLKLQLAASAFFMWWSVGGPVFHHRIISYLKQHDNLWSVATCQVLSALQIITQLIHETEEEMEVPKDEVTCLRL